MSKRQSIFNKNRNIDIEEEEMAEDFESQIRSMQITIDTLKDQLQCNASNANVSNQNTETNFMNLGRIPDIVKEIPQFDGNPTKLVQWISDVDGVIDLFTQFADTPQHKLIVRTIRRKVVGEANEVLVNSSTRLSWENIRQTLTLHYSDRRDLMTLTVQLVMLNRKNDSIETFYAKIQEIHSLLTNSIQLDNSYIGYEAGILKLYSNICLETFIRGVGPMSPFLKNFKPKSLSQAYQYALDFQNTNFRSSIQIPSSIPQFTPTRNYNNSIKPVIPRYYEPQNPHLSNFQNRVERPIQLEVDRNNRHRFSNFQNNPTSPQNSNRNFIPSWRQPEPRKMAHVAQIDDSSYNNEYHQRNEMNLYNQNIDKNIDRHFEYIEGNFRQSPEQNNVT